VSKKLQQQEAENTRINKLKLLNMHRAYMRVEKVAELRKEIELLTQSHGQWLILGARCRGCSWLCPPDHNMQRNDAFVEMLLHDLDDAEEQHQTAQRAHAGKLRQLSELHSSKVLRCPRVCVSSSASFFNHCTGQPAAARV
jgi:hypothetical protein